jgi:predicted kinase
VWHPEHSAPLAASAGAVATRLGLLAAGAGSAAPAGIWRPLVARWLEGPLMLLVGGEVATGKSHVARGLAALCGGTHLSSDGLREELFPLATVGSAVKYGASASAAMFRVLALEAETRLRQGQAVVCDAVLRGRSLQADLRTRARACGARVVAITCVCAEPEQRARLRARRPAADHFSEAGEPVLDLLRARERERPEEYAALVESPELADAHARIVADSTPGAARARIVGARTPLAVWFATALGAGLC